MLIHGFTGGPPEVLPLAEYLGELGYATEFPILAGHAGDPRKLGEVTYRDWLESIETSYHKLNNRCRKIVVIGFSMGGLLAVNLALKQSVQALVVLSAPIYVWDLKRMVFKFPQRPQRPRF